MGEKNRQIFIENLINASKYHKNDIKKELNNVINFLSNPSNIGANFQVDEPDVYEYYTKDNSENKCVWFDVVDIIIEIFEQLNFKKGNSPYIFCKDYFNGSQYFFCDNNCLRILF